MWRKFKDWLYLRFLPAWAKDGVYKDNERLREEIRQLQHELDRRESYIEGLERGIRSARRVTINNHTGGKV